MKPALQALLISPDIEAREKIIAGTKTVTIREGHRDYLARRPAMLCCHLKPWAVMADIVEVRHCTFAQVTLQECLDAGYPAKRDLLSALREFYADLDSLTAVTVIRWTNVRGKLVDECRASPQAQGRCCA